MQDVRAYGLVYLSGMPVVALSFLKGVLAAWQISLQLMFFCTTLPIKLKLGPFAIALSAIYTFSIWCLNRPQEKGVLSRISSGSFSFPALLTWRVYTKWKSRSQHCAPSSVKNTHKLNHLNLNKIPSGDMGEKKVDGNLSALFKKKIKNETSHRAWRQALRLLSVPQFHNM